LATDCCCCCFVEWWLVAVAGTSCWAKNEATVGTGPLARNTEEMAGECCCCCCCWVGAAGKLVPRRQFCCCCCKLGLVAWKEELFLEEYASGGELIFSLIRSVNWF
jgi:hypothetical protein